MRLVDQALIRPHHCAVYPQLGQTHKDSYFDTGNELAGFDNHIYISVAAVKEMAAQLGYVPPEEHTVQKNRLVAAQERVESLEMVVEQKQKALDAIDFLGSHDFIARKKRGPKPAAQVA